MNWIGLYRVVVVVLVERRRDGAHCTVQSGKTVSGARHSVESRGTYLDKIKSLVKATPR